MKTRSHKQISPERVIVSRRRGVAAKEVVLSTVIVMVFGMGLYFLGQDSFVRLHHFVSTLVGSPYQ